MAGYGIRMHAFASLAFYPTDLMTEPEVNRYSGFCLLDSISISFQQSLMSLTRSFGPRCLLLRHCRSNMDPDQNRICYDKCDVFSFSFKFSVSFCLISL